MIYYLYCFCCPVPFILKGKKLATQEIYYSRSTSPSLCNAGRGL